MAALLLLVVVVVTLVVLRNLREELRRLRERVDLLELVRSAEPRPPEVATDAAPPPPESATATLPGAEPTPAGGESRPPAAEPEAVAWPTPSAPPAAAAPRRDAASLEQLVGGIWLQNVGVVVVLLGVFLMIVWGYSTGRLGPPALVAAGVALGLALVWRGDRVARSTPAFGHALIGLGLGIVYIALHVGHFRLAALPRVPAFVALAVVSLATVAIGLRYRVPTIAGLGVIGAFVPRLAVVWAPDSSFPLPAPVLLAYVAIVDCLVFLLAATAGWSGLGIAALFLTALTWAAAFQGPDWSWAVQIGLATLFLGLGLAPLPRFARAAGRLRAVDIGLIAAAPLCFLAASSPMLSYAGRTRIAALLFTLAALHLAAALWTRGRRADPDLWRPLTGAAILYLTIALERGLGTEHTPLAWTMEGVVLVILGARAGGGWLRLCGSLVTLPGLLWLFGTLVSGGSGTEARIAAPDAVRGLVAVTGLLVAAHRLARAREHLTRDESLLPEVWSAAGLLLLTAWSAREAAAIANAVWGPGSARLPTPASDRARLDTLRAALTSGAWVVEAVAVLVAGWLRESAFLRWCGLALFGLTLMKFLLVDLRSVDVFWRFLTAIAVGAAMLAISYAYQARARRR